MVLLGDRYFGLPPYGPMYGPIRISEGLGLQEHPGVQGSQVLGVGLGRASEGLRATLGPKP